MQKCVKIALLVSAIAISLLSCSKQEMEAPIRLNKTSRIEIIDFRGEKVVVPSDFPKSLFEQSQEEFDRYYQSISGASEFRTSGGDIHITYQELLPILVKHLSKFPRLNSEDEISETDLRRIFQDFPEIRTREDADEKRMVIFDFYQTLAKRDIVAEVVALENRLGRNGRTTDISPASLTTPEKNHLLANPSYAQWYVQAANDANSLTKTFYLNEKLGDKANAFKHSTWNALSIRFILKGSPASENQAIDFTQDGTSKHEQDNFGNQTQDIYSAMDLHNNMSAREWMSNETKWGIGPFRSMPSADEIISTMLSRANSSGLESLETILNWHGGNNMTTWNNLYNNLYSPLQHLVHIEI